MLNKYLNCFILFWFEKQYNASYVLGLVWSMSLDIYNMFSNYLQSRTQLVIYWTDDYVHTFWNLALMTEPCFSFIFNW